MALNIQTAIGELIIDPAAENFPLTRRVREALSGLRPRSLSQEALMAEARDNPVSISESKKRLFITVDPGKQLKRCPGTRGRICCNYFVINQGIGCPYDCSYCFLQDFSNLPAIFVYANTEDMLAEIEQHLRRHPDAFFRIGTGEMTDSLALDDLTKLSRELVPFFARSDNALLELKTKSDCVENLADLEHRKHTVISWSLNPPSVIASDEKDSASLEARLKAARRVQDCGYPLAFHFDPLVIQPGTEKDYETLLKMLPDYIDPEHIAWISLGSFRYRPSMKSIMDERFPRSRLTAGEHVHCNDGKMRYFKNQRVALYRKMVRGLQNWHPDLFIYFCMEDRDIWQAVLGKRPASMQAVDTLFRNALGR